MKDEKIAKCELDRSELYQALEKDSKIQEDEREG
jgi:hypothetical protein